MRREQAVQDEGEGEQQKAHEVCGAGLQPRR
jgi:hypothetical protein